MAITVHEIRVPMAHDELISINVTFMSFMNEYLPQKVSVYDDIHIDYTSTEEHECQRSLPIWKWFF